MYLFKRYIVESESFFKTFYCRITSRESDSNISNNVVMMIRAGKSKFAGKRRNVTPSRVLVPLCPASALCHCISMKGVQNRGGGYNFLPVLFPPSALLFPGHFGR